MASTSSTIAPVEAKSILSGSDENDFSVRAIWNKISKWNTSCNNLSDEIWFHDYTTFAVMIYLKRNITKISKKLELYKQTNQINEQHYHKIINNLMFLLCIYCVDVRIFDNFTTFFFETIDICEFYLDHSMSYLAILLQRPDKPLQCIKCYIDLFEKSDPTYSVEWIHQDVEYNCLQAAIKTYNYQYRASNQATIEYMINDLMVKPARPKRYYDNDDMMSIALGNNKSDVHLIKWIVEKVGFDDNFRRKYFSRALMTFVKIKNKRDIINFSQIIGCLIEMMSIEQTNEQRLDSLTNYMFVNKFKHPKYMILSIKNPHKLNIMLKKLISMKKYKKTKIVKLMRSIDPMMLDDQNCEYAGITGMNSKCCKHIKFFNIDKFDFLKPESIQSNHPINQLDNRRPPELLFRYNQIPYYGNRQIYDYIDFFRDNDAVNHGEAEFEGDMPYYLINTYLNQTMSGVVDIDHILPEDIFKFVRFIDQYPSTTLTVPLIENHLIRYIATNGILMNNIPQSTHDIFTRHGCKYFILSRLKRNDPVSLHQDMLVFDDSNLSDDDLSGNDVYDSSFSITFILFFSALYFIIFINSRYGIL